MEKLAFTAISVVFIVFVPQIETKGLASLFEAGKASYLDNDWPACVTNFEAALKAYRSFRRINLSCKRQAAHRIFCNIIVSVRIIKFFEKEVLTQQI